MANDIKGIAPQREALFAWNRRLSYTIYTVEPPMKHILCRASSLADVTTRTSVLEKVQGIESVTISLDREVLVSTDLRHSLIREKIRKLEQNKMLAL
jgi:hypothetical protein